MAEIISRIIWKPGTIEGKKKDHRLGCISITSSVGAHMRRVVILGQGASGKSTLARRLGEITGIPVIELDKVFWPAGLNAPPGNEWAVIQEKLAAENEWIMDGDVGPNDVAEVRLRQADTVIFLDFSLVRCAWRAVLRSRERADFWRWLLWYRSQSRPLLMQAIANHAGKADLHVFRRPKALRCFVAEVAKTHDGDVEQKR